MLLFDPLLVFLGTACMKDSQMQTSQEDGKGGNESTSRSLCLLQPEPPEVWWFLYILSPKEGTSRDRRTEQNRSSWMRAVLQGTVPYCQKCFFLSRLATSKILNNSIGS